MTIDPDTLQTFRDIYFGARQTICECQLRLNQPPPKQQTHLVSIAGDSFACFEFPWRQGERLKQSQNPFQASWLSEADARKYAANLQTKTAIRVVSWLDALKQTIEHRTQIRATYRRLEKLQLFTHEVEQRLDHVFTEVRQLENALWLNHSRPSDAYYLCIFNKEPRTELGAMLNGPHRLSQDVPVIDERAKAIYTARYYPLGFGNAAILSQQFQQAAEQLKAQGINYVAHLAISPYRLLPLETLSHQPLKLRQTRRVRPEVTP